MVATTPDGARARARIARSARDRGAAAVEFALVLPMILLLVFGMIDFGRALLTQIALTQAAREGARASALSLPGIPARVQDAASPPLAPGSVGVAIVACPATPAATDQTTVTATSTFTFVTPYGAIAALFGGAGGGTIAMSGRGVMRCLG